MEEGNRRKGTQEVEQGLEAALNAAASECWDVLKGNKCSVNAIGMICWPGMVLRSAKRVVV